MQVGISWLHTEKTFRTDLANPFSPDLWGYVHGFSYWSNLWVDYIWQISLRRTLWGFEHRFGHKLGINLKSQHTIKVRSLEATLSATILICNVFCVRLPEQDITRKGRVYENPTRCTKWEAFWNSTVFAKESEPSSRRSASLVWQQKHLGACIGSLTPGS